MESNGQKYITLFKYAIINKWLLNSEYPSLLVEMTSAPRGRKADLEAMLSESDRQVDVLPRPLPSRCGLPAEFPQCGPHAQQAVNHPDGQLPWDREVTRSPGQRGKEWEEHLRGHYTFELSYRCEPRSRWEQNQSSGCRRGPRGPGGGSVSGPRSAAGRGPRIRTGTPLRDEEETHVLWFGDFPRQMSEELSRGGPYLQMWHFGGAPNLDPRCWRRSTRSCPRGTRSPLRKGFEETCHSKWRLSVSYL